MPAERIVHSERPLNAETTRWTLGEAFLTPAERFYVRSHGTLPELGAEGHRIAVGGLVERALELTLADLAELPQVTVTATLACAGNRRDGLLAVRAIPGETPWGPGAIGTAEWRGPPLGAVLARAGVRAEARHVAFAGRDECATENGTTVFGGSIPLERALAPDVLLATHMNGAPLGAEHGAPVRALVPGHIGARSVKWLDEITVRDAPSDNHFQARAYRLAPPWADADTPPEAGPMLGELQVNSAICRPDDGATVSPGPLEVSGWAIAGGCRQVVRVDVSSDGGATWLPADLGEDRGPRAWRLWRATLDLGAGPHTLFARAVDAAADSQPGDAAAIWNVKGYANNAWHRVRVEAV